MSLDMQPHQKQHEQRRENMHEHHKCEKPTAKGCAVKEIVRDGLAKKRQCVDPLGGRNGDVLGQLVPHQPVAGDTAHVHKPNQWHAGYPGEESPAAQPV